MRAKPRSRQFVAAAIPLTAAGATALARPDRPDRPSRRSVAAAIAERARLLGSRRIGRCPGCGRTVRTGDDLVRLDDVVFHAECARRAEAS